MENNNKSSNPFLPLFFALILVVGILLGMRLNQNAQNRALLNFFSSKSANKNKVDEVLDYVVREYVDTINRDTINDETIELLLSNLDPHSSYIPAKNLAETNEPLQGNFEGVGIEFNVLNDTIYVVAVIKDGPSEKAGVKKGDRIISVDGKKVAGIKISNEDVIKTLRGIEGSTVNVTILTSENKKLKDFAIKRGRIPIYSIDASYMINQQTGYIKISRFGSTTYQEFLDALNQLKRNGLTKLVLDLRGNPGGYLDAAISICDEFLSANKMIVYTQGKNRKREEYKSTEKGIFEKEKLVILIDEGAASASEIVAGAIQDNDRGTIIGRRSFGKGLVQEQTEFTDGSALRLTIARYYTPTGRCIQKPYTKGKLSEYYHDEINRYQNGELENVDSIHLNKKLKFTTPAGKIVYGGGGIMPDIFIPIDTSFQNNYSNKLFYKGIINDFALLYYDREKQNLKYSNYNDFDKKFEVNTTIINNLVDYAKQHGIEPNKDGLNQSLTLIKETFKAHLAKNIFNQDAWYFVRNKTDKTCLKALEVLE